MLREIQSRRSGLLIALAVALAAGLAASPAVAASESAPSFNAPRPGPAILYAPPPRAPQLENATRSVEAMRVRAALVEKAEERRLACIERFLLAVNAWLDWLTYLAEQPSEDHFPELNQRVKERDDAYRKLILLSSERLHRWLTDVYSPLEYELKRTYAHEVRYHARSVSGEARNARAEFSRFLREDLIDQLRPEVEALRDPVRRVRAIKISRDNEGVSRRSKPDA